MERIRQMTDTRRCAFLWAATVLLTAALLFLCGGKVHAQEEDDDWMRDTLSRYTMAAMLSGQEENYFSDSEKPDALTVLNYTAYKMYQNEEIVTIPFDKFYEDYVCANFSAVVDKESLKNVAKLDNGKSIFFDYKSDTDEISILDMPAGGDPKQCVYIGWQDKNNKQTVLYGIWQDPEAPGSECYVTLTISGFEDNAKIVSYQKIESKDVKFSSEFFINNYDDNNEWVDETNCTRKLGGKTRVILPYNEDVHSRATMTYNGEEVVTTGLAGVKVTSPDEDIVSVYDNNENYEEISSVSGDKVGTVNLTCEFKSRTGETVYTEILPCDVAKFEAGRDNARYDSYGMCVLYNTDVEIFAKTEGLDEYKKQKLISYEWKSAEIPEIDGKTTESVTYTAPNNEKKAEISVDIYIDGEKITTQSVSLKVKNGVLDYKVYEMPGTAMKEQDTTAPLLLNKRYFIDLAGGDFGWDYGNNADQCFSSWEFTMDSKTFTITDKEVEDYKTPIQQPDFMTYYRGFAGGGTPNCLFTVKKAGQLTVTGTIYQNNKVFRTISKTFTVKSENTNGTTPKPQQPASLQKGTKVTDKKSKAVYKVNGNKTVEYNKADKKAKKATVPSTITVNGVKYQVTSIAAKAFANNKKLTKIVIPASVRSIGKQAFSGCKNLKSITIKTTYLTKKSVGAKAFKGIHAKATIKVPKKQKKAYQKFLKTKGIGKGVKIK
nr:leucine-rich repeat domain-containing protein [uncultured Anaerobutyricum sp.]